MANINVTYTENTITVDETTSNVTVTETVSNIIVSSSAVASNADIRAALSASSPVTYNSTTGVIGIDSSSLFTGKTTTDLPEGANLYFTNARVAAYLTSNFTTTDIPEGANLYYTNARANAAIATVLANTVVTFQNNAIFEEGFRTPVYDAGSFSGGPVQLTMENGPAQEIRLTGNVGYVSWTDAPDGIVLHLIVKQDSTGGRTIDFSDPSYAVNGWEFLNGVTTIDTAANAETLITIETFSNKRYATINTGNTTSLTNAQVISYIGSNSLTVGGNLLVTGNNLTVSNILIPGSETTSPVQAGWTNQGLIRIPGGGNVIIGPRNGYSYNAIDIPGNPTHPIQLGKAIYSPYSARFEQTVTGGGFYADGGGSISTGTGNIETTNGNIRSINGSIVGAYLHGNGSNITGIASNAGVVSYIATQPLTVGGNLTVNGNINATGNINYQNVTDLYVTDQKITLNSNAATNANVEVISNRPTATNTSLKWNEQSTRWEFTNNGTTYYPIPTSTTDLAEGSNLWFTAARTNTAIDNYLIGGTGISYSSGTIALDFTEFDTGNITEGTNLYFTAARARGNISAAENITYNSSTGVIGLANALANVSTITAEAGQNLTLNTAGDALIVKQKYSNIDVYSGNISSDGYALFTANQYSGEYVTYTGSANIENYIFEFGSATAGSNAITGVSLLNYFADTAESISNAQVGLFIQHLEFDTFPFPVGTRVTSVDAANSIIYVSQNATTTSNIDLDFATGSVWGLSPALHDSETGLTIGLVSEYDAQISSSKTTLAYDPGQGIVGTFICTQSRYGYPATGPVITDFDVVSAGTITDYSLGPDSFSSLFIGRNKIESPKSVFQAPRGLIVGESADLTNRAENDTLPSFGINVLWDGQTDPTEYNGQTPLTQILVKSYTDNSLQSINRTTAGPRIFFTAAEGNASESIAQTYPLKNLELGRIAWWSTSSTTAGLSSTAPPAWISGVTGQDCVNNNSGVGMYFGISPNTSTDNFNRSLYLASSMGNTLIASAQDSTGSHRPIIFAPSYFGSNQGNSALLYNQTITGSDPNTTTIQTSGAHFAQINYNNTSALTGAKVSVTNGNNSTTQREGNLVLSIDRNLTSANANVRVRTGGVNFIGSSNPDRVRFSFAPDGLVDGTAVTINNFVVAPAITLNGNVFYVKGPFVSGSFRDYELYYDSGLTSGVNVGTTNVQAGAGTFEYTRNNAVTAKEWSWVLPQGSNSLILAEDGVTRATFSNTTGDLTITGRHTYDRVYGEFCYTGGNISPVAADTIYSFPFDTTNMSSDVVANNTSRINITKPGIFKLITSIQVDNTGNTTDNILNFWLRKNGTDVANSTTQVDCLKLQKQVIAMDWMVESDGDDYFEIVYFVNSTEIVFPYVGPQTSPVTYPATPPIIINVIPVGA